MYHWNPRFEFQHPPGSYEQVISHPARAETQMPVGISHEHRFAFYFWARWLTNRVNASSKARPNLLTIDWHRDLATPSDQEKKDLESLDPTDSNELSLFSWGYLNPHNDDHVLSAAYKNLIGDVFVLCKQKFTNPDLIEDYRGNTHSVHVFQDKSTLAEALDDSHDLFLDIDLDYFTESDSFMGMDADVEMSSPEEIKKLLDPHSALFQKIFNCISGFTIALEPKFCGGYYNSSQLFNLLDEQLFNATLLHQTANWRHLDT